MSGSILVGLLAARNAGIEVPDESIDRAISYYKSMTSPSGQVGYSGGFGGFDESPARISIASLVYSLARRKDLPQFEATIGHLIERWSSPAGPVSGGKTISGLLPSPGPVPGGDVEAWKKWNKLLVRQPAQDGHAAQADGSIPGQHGVPGRHLVGPYWRWRLNYKFLPIYTNVNLRSSRCSEQQIPHETSSRRHRLVVHRERNDGCGAADAPQCCISRMMATFLERLLGSDKPTVLRWRFRRPSRSRLSSRWALRQSRALSGPGHTRSRSASTGYELVGDDMLYGDLLAAWRRDELEVGRRHEWPPAHSTRRHPPDVPLEGRGSGLSRAEWPGPLERRGVDATQWRERRRPAIHEIDPDATIVADLGMPDKAAIEVEVSWKNKPDFVLALGIDGREEANKPSAPSGRERLARPATRCCSSQRNA